MTMKRMLILLLPLCLLAGCWDRNEINEMAIVMGTALDKQDEENIELSVQIIIPQSIAMGSQEMGSQQGGQGIGKHTPCSLWCNDNCENSVNPLRQKLGTFKSPMKQFENNE